LFDELFNGGDMTGGLDDTAVSQWVSDAGLVFAAASNDNKRTMSYKVKLPGK